MLNLKKCIFTGPPRFIRYPQSHVFMSGEDILLLCEVEYASGVLFQWTYNDKLLDFTQYQLSYLETNSLIRSGLRINPASRNDEGNKVIMIYFILFIFTCILFVVFLLYQPHTSNPFAISPSLSISCLPSFVFLTLSYTRQSVYILTVSFTSLVIEHILKAYTW